MRFRKPRLLPTSEINLMEIRQSATTQFPV